jgi:hypothetical protein
MRAGARLLKMATDPISRGILRSVLEHPVERSAMTGVTARIEEGRVVSCHDGLDIKANAWAAATAADWLDTVVEPDAKRVRTGGDRWLSGALLDGLHKTLFGVPVG